MLLRECDTVIIFPTTNINIIVQNGNFYQNIFEVDKHNASHYATL